MDLYQSLRAVFIPYSGLSSSIAAFPFFTKSGSFTCVPRFKAPDLKNARDTAITQKIHFLYAITAITTIMICNCTAGADAFDVANSRKTFYAGRRV